MVQMEQKETLVSAKDLWWETKMNKSGNTVKQVCVQFWWAPMSKRSRGPKILDFHAVTANKGFDEGVK